MVREWGHSARSRGRSGPVHFGAPGPKFNSRAEHDGHGLVPGRIAKSRRTTSMHEIASRRRVALGLVAGALLVGTLAGPVLAADTVVVAITGSGLTASVAD